MSSRKATKSFCFVHTMQYIYEEDKKSALEHLGWQAMFKFRAIWSIRDGKGLFRMSFSILLEQVVKCMNSDPARFLWDLVTFDM